MSAITMFAAPSFQISASRMPRVDGITLAGLAALAAAAALAVAAALQPWADPRLLFMDTVAAADRADYCCRVYYGAMSHLGVVVWAFAAAVSLFGAACLLALRDRSTVVLALSVAGAISLVLVFDDLLMLHETVLPKLGVPQNLVLALYAALGGSYALLQWRTLLSFSGLFLALSLAMFGGSLELDVAWEGGGDRVRVAEDVFKFVGITAWAVFHGELAFRAVVSAGGGRRFDPAPL